MTGPTVFSIPPAPSRLLWLRKRFFRWAKGRRVRERRRELDRLVRDPARMRRIAGPESPPSDVDAVLLCPVRNGAYWLPSFLAHYRELGCFHMVFVDNGSSDETLSLLTDQPDITVFVTDLPFDRYQVPLRQWMLDTFARGRWALTVDVDELWDYPGSDRLSLSGFLDYLDRNRFTVVLGHMLELYGAEPLGMDLAAGSPAVDLKEAYPLYDLVDLSLHPRGFWLLDGSTEPRYMPVTGGVRRRVFGEMALLTKFPLVRHTGAVRLFPYNAHFHLGGALADVSTVLLHYKFVRPLFGQARAVVEGTRLVDNVGASRSYLRELSGDRELSLTCADTRVYRDALGLVDDGYLFMSDAYARAVSNGALQEPLYGV